MSRRRDTDDMPQGLTHNPFAALRPDGAPAPKDSAPAPEPQEEDAPTAGRLVVRRESKGRAGKTVTRVTGLADPAGIASELKRALGCGASVDGDDVLLQGALVERAAVWLEEKLEVRVVRGN